jgi:hypothetical protein
MRANLWVTLCLAFVGCGGGGSALRVMHPSSPFLEADAPLFEDGVDMIGDPEGLSGRWADEWATSLQDRVARSDVIALMTVNTLRTDVSPEQRTTHWLVAEVGDVFKGKYEGELSLSSSDDAIGFDSVDREKSNVLHKQMVVFAKWVLEQDGSVRAHWHLALGSRNIVDAVRLQLGVQPASSKTTIIERTTQ